MSASDDDTAQKEARRVALSRTGLGDHHSSSEDFEADPLEITSNAGIARRKRAKRNAGRRTGFMMKQGPLKVCAGLGLCGPLDCHLCGAEQISRRLI